MPARKPKPRNKKGTVAVSARNGMLRLRWRYQGQPYEMALGMPDTPLNRHLTQGKASQIQADIAYDRFDETLVAYKTQLDQVAAPLQTSAQLFEQYIDHRREEGTSGQAIAARYKPMLSHLKRFGQRIEDTETARALVELLRDRQSPRIANQSLTMLKSFGQWCVEQDLSLSNPYSPIKPLKGGARGQKRRPFTKDELKAFFEALRSDPTYYCYSDFCYVMLSLGIRPSETIGLRWQHIDLEGKRVTICESLSRSEDGKTAGYARQRKTTKTVNIRVLPLSDRLVALLRGRRPAQSQPDDLVFTTKTGVPIDDHNFRERVWKRTCTRAGIDYRPPYTSRHTLLSHGIEYEGWSLPQAAQIAGHSSTRMVAETYGHAIDPPRMPEF